MCALKVGFDALATWVLRCPCPNRYHHFTSVSLLPLRFEAWSVICSCLGCLALVQTRELRFLGAGVSPHLRYILVTIPVQGKVPLVCGLSRLLIELKVAFPGTW